MLCEHERVEYTEQRLLLRLHPLHYVCLRVIVILVIVLLGYHVSALNLALQLRDDAEYVVKLCGQLLLRRPQPAPVVSQLHYLRHQLLLIQVLLLQETPNQLR